MERFYLPILKAKGGEFTALSKLNFSIKSWVFPLFEITQPEFDNKTNSTATTLEKHLLKLCEKIEKHWPYDHSFIDIDLVKGEIVQGGTAYEFIYKTLAKSTIVPIPVARLNMPVRVLAGLNVIISDYSIRKIGIRVTIEDVDSLDFSNDLNALLQSLNLSPQNCHMVLDLMDSDFSETENFSDGVMGILERFPRQQDWYTFTLAGGAFPITGKLREGVQEVTRGDWKLYKTVLAKLKQTQFDRPINYGDYSVIAPGHFVYDPIRMQTSANIRYAHDDMWFVIKGKSLKVNGYEQYFFISNDIKSSKYFYGQNYSAGDEHIFKCSQRNTTSGNPQVWKWVGNNHHITKVVNDLFANPSDF